MDRNKKFLKIQIREIQKYQLKHKSEKSETKLVLEWISKFASQFRKDWELQKQN